jgi:hypothetical protein
MRKIVLVSILLISLLLVGCRLPGGDPIYTTTGIPTQPSLPGSTTQANTTTLPTFPTDLHSQASTTETSLSFEVTYSKALSFINADKTVGAQVLIEITNTGTGNLYLQQGAFDLVDSGNQVVVSKRAVPAFPSVIVPGEKAYYYDVVPLYMANAVELQVVPHPDVVEARIDCIRLPVTAKMKKDAGSGMTITGTVQNTSKQDQSRVLISCILYDAQHLPISHLLTTITSKVAAGASADFSMSSASLPPAITADMISGYSIRAFPQQQQP